MCMAKLFCVLALLYLQLLNVAKADNRLPDHTQCDLVEQNIVLDKKTGKFNFEQLVSFRNYYDSEYQGLGAMTYVYMSEFQAVYPLDHGFLLELKNGALVRTKSWYNSITTYDVEQRYKRAYYSWEPVFYPRKFIRRKYIEPSIDFVLPQGEEDPTDLIQKI